MEKIILTFVLVGLVVAAPLESAVKPLTAEQMEKSSSESATSGSSNSGNTGSAMAEPHPPPAPVPAMAEQGSRDKESLKIPAPDPSMNTPTSQPPAADKSSSSSVLDMIVVIPTVRRLKSDGNPAPERYLAPLVDKMWYDMNGEQKQHVRFFILNSDKEPNKHEEALGLATHPGVTLFTKMAQKEQIVDQAISGYNQLEDGRFVSSNWLGWVASENLDAAFLFEKAKRQAPYILFMEDDVMPTTNMLVKLSKFVREFPKDDWMFLDLYTPNVNWAPTSFSNGDVYKFQCCTQAMLFRSDRIDGVIEYLIQHPREPIDDNLRNYQATIATGLNIYALRPNLVEHVGAYSSNPEKSTGIVEHTSIEFVPLL